MKSLFHNDKFYKPHLISFISDLPDMFDALKTEFEAGQYKNTKQSCHRIAGAAATFGYPDLAREFQDVEILLENEKPDIVEIEKVLNLVHKQIHSLSTEGLV